MIVVGLDLSLTSTGLATSGSTDLITPGSRTGYERLRFIRSAVIDYVARMLPDLLVVEGPSYGSEGAGAHERAGLWWYVTEALDDAGVPIAVASPSTIKKYAVGVGSGKKSAKDYVLLAAARRFEWFEGNNDQADALWAAALGYQHLGEPICSVPQQHLDAVEGVKWPSLMMVPS